MAKDINGLQKRQTLRKNWLKKCAVQQYATADVKFASVLILPIICMYISVCTVLGQWAPTSASTGTALYGHLCMPYMS